jgi:hypothetical protein
VRNHGAIAVGILALTAGIAASGCGESSNAEAESLSVTTTKQVETPAFDISQFRAAFTEAYGTPPNRMPWYGLITGMKMNGTSLVVTTKLPPSSAWDGKEGTWGDAGTICGAAVGVAVDLGLKNADTRKRSAIEGVFMVGSGVGLGSCA